MKERISALVEDKSGVSPVIGVILMVAITVILAAVIGTFVLGLGNQVGNAAPTASLTVQDASATYNENATTGTQNIFTIDHNSGDTLEEANLRITIRNASNAIVGTFDPASQNINNFGKNSTDANWLLNSADLATDDQITIGDSLTLVEDAATGNASLSNSTDYQVTVIHKPSDSQVAQQTVTLR